MDEGFGPINLVAISRQNYKTNDLPFGFFKLSRNVMIMRYLFILCSLSTYTVVKGKITNIIFCKHFMKGFY